ncbi:MAG: nuclear transport factor 2 family protein [Burkholderiales bacterium]
MSPRSGSEARERLYDLVADYGLLLDEDKLEAWVDLFAEDATYKIITRENVEQGLPQILVWANSKNMLRDRVDAYRHVNEYNLHWDRHVIGAPRLRDRGDGTWHLEASYSLFQTDMEGVSRLFSVGRYDMTVRFTSEAASIASVVVIVDTAAIPTLLATPI